MVPKRVYMHVHCWLHSDTYFLNDTYSDTYCICYLLLTQQIEVNI